LLFLCGGVVLASSSQDTTIPSTPAEEAVAALLFSSFEEQSIEQSDREKNDMETSQ